MVAPGSKLKSFEMPEELLARMRKAMAKLEIFREAEFIRKAIEEKIERTNLE